ncbi:hypothetical protein [Chrysiogenes arsenatis]|uniref:hypothetical protein n=1 Tax=Chrysiogenes arsenatis TaxID=309797 RepID=UPI000484A26B|nr:hypothetical protein [Chrysiogenes arsenatis]
MRWLFVGIFCCYFSVFPPLVLAQDDDLLHASLHAEFASFAVQWIEKVRTNTVPRPDKKEVIPNGTHFTGRYAAIDPASVDFSVKRSGATINSPWVATLQYLEGVYEHQAISMEEALNGAAFELVRLRRITEVFRYDAVRKRWVE